MNEFTKDELILIEEFFLEQEEVPDMPYIHLDLLRKIQSMIDNYDAKVIKAWHCEKCGHVQ